MRKKRGMISMSINFKVLTVGIVTMFIVTCGFIASSVDADSEDPWKGVNYVYVFEHERGKTGLSINITYQISIGTDFIIASWDVAEQCFDMENGTKYVIPDSIWSYQFPYYDVFVDRSVVKPGSNMVLAGWSESMTDLSVDYLPGEVVTAADIHNLVLFSVFVETEFFPEPEVIPELRPYVRPNSILQQNVVEKVVLSFYANDLLVHVSEIEKGTRAFEPFLPMGFTAWDFDFSQPVLSDAKVYAIPGIYSGDQEVTKNVWDNVWFWLFLIIVLISAMIIALYLRRKMEENPEDDEEEEEIVF
jgi:hypothetical protein